VCDFIPECVRKLALLSDISDCLLVKTSSVLIRFSPGESSKTCTGAQASLPAAFTQERDGIQVDRNANGAAGILPAAFTQESDEIQVDRNANGAQASCLLPLPRNLMESRSIEASRQAGMPALPNHRNFSTNSADCIRSSSQLSKIAGSCNQIVSH
jgi:hypothetical protein